MAHTNFENVNSTYTKTFLSRFLGLLNTTHHVFFEFQPKKDKTYFVKRKKYSTDPYKHKMAAP